MVVLLKKMIRSSSVKEVYIDSRTVAVRDEFERLGLADCGLLAVITPETPLLTADFDLMRAALDLDSRMVACFTFRDL